MPQSSSQAPQSALSPAASSPNLASNGALISMLTIAFALSFVLASLGYKKYRAHQRTQLLKRQIAMLEAMWRINSTKRER